MSFPSDAEWFGLEIARILVDDVCRRLDMVQLRLIPNRDRTRHELEQKLDALARECGVTKDKKVLDQMLEVCGRIEKLKSKGD